MDRIAKRRLIREIASELNYIMSYNTQIQKILNAVIQNLTKNVRNHLVEFIFNFADEERNIWGKIANKIFSVWDIFI